MRLIRAFGAGLLCLSIVAMSLYVGGANLLVELPRATGWLAFGHALLGLIATAIAVLVTISIGDATVRAADADRKDESA